jgi:phosphocarrier protein HPr
MKEVRTFSLKNELGLHARAAAMLVAVSSKFKSKVIFERDGKEINGKSILGILTLACPKGSHITIRAEGDDALEVMEQLGNLIEGKFGED